MRARLPVHAAKAALTAVVVGVWVSVGWRLSRGASAPPGRARVGEVLPEAPAPREPYALRLAFRDDLFALPRRGGRSAGDRRATPGPQPAPRARAASAAPRGVTRAYDHSRIAYVGFVAADGAPPLAIVRLGDGTEEEVSAADALGDYRVESIAEDGLVLRHLPSDSAVTLALGGY